MHKIESILIYSGGEILGDGILKLPFIKALRDAYPKARIVWLTRDASLYDSLLKPLIAPYNIEVIDKTSIGRSFKEFFHGKFLPEMFDVILDTQKSRKRSLLLRRQIRHKRYISLYGKTTPAHFVDQLLFLATQLTGKNYDRHTPLNWQHDNAAELKKIWLKSIKSPICLIPGAGNKKKAWPLQRYIALATHIQDNTPHTPVFLLGPEEIEWVGEVAAAGFSPIGWQEKNGAWAYTLSVQDVITLAPIFTATIGNDCGAGHLLATAQKPQISLFGRHTAEKYAPLNPHVRVIDAKNFGGEEMRLIPLESVVQELQDLL